MEVIQLTKVERREKRKRNKEKMRVTGVGNRLLQKIIVDKSKQGY